MTATRALQSPLMDDVNARRVAFEHAPIPTTDSTQRNPRTNHDRLADTSESDPRGVPPSPDTQMTAGEVSERSGAPKMFPTTPEATSPRAWWLL